jgi:hypothetical protein
MSPFDKPLQKLLLSKALLSIFKVFKSKLKLKISSNGYFV